MISKETAISITETYEAIADCKNAIGVLSSKKNDVSANICIFKNDNDEGKIAEIEFPYALEVLIKQLASNENQLIVLNKKAREENKKGENYERESRRSTNGN